MSKISNLRHRGRERSSTSHAYLDEASRRRKAAKIVSVVSNYKDPATAHILDIGTGSGHIASSLAEAAKQVTSVDVTDERKVVEGYDFVKVTDERLPFADNTFDIVVSNHVIEHIPNQANHLREVLRVVKPDGIVYLATPNKWWVSDPHYELPFISWLPRQVSNAYVRLFKRGEAWDVYPVSTIMCKKWLNPSHVTMYNALPDLVTTAASKELDTWQAGARLLGRLPSFVLDLTKYVSPTLIFILSKQEQTN